VLSGAKDKGERATSNAPLGAVDPDGPVLVVSPHLDDAVLSAGASMAAMAAAGRTVVMCTVFSGRPTGPLSETAVQLHRLCGLGDDAVVTRWAEDRSASRAIGASPVHLDYLDAVYRRQGDDWLCRQFGAYFDDLPAEPALAADITAELRILIQSHRPAAVWTCAAVGDHVDHRMTLTAVTAACADEGVDLMVWEDLPYAIGRPAARRRGEVSPTSIAAAQQARKLDAIACYNSQLSMLFPDSPGWRAAFVSHAADRLATHHTPELLWHAHE
jgi:LmbE family N-acetylglucosaminyl deacetylase